MNRRRFITGSAIAAATAVSGSRAASAIRSVPPLPERPQMAPPVREVHARDDQRFSFSPDQTALLVIDMQKDFFVGDDGEYDPALAPIVPRVAKLVAFARAIGCRVIHTREGYASDLSDVNPSRKSLGYIGRNTSMGRFLIRGDPGQDFLDEMRPQPNEVVFDKPSFDAFYQSSLGDHLRRASVSHLILCGVTTQCCVLSTLKGAVDSGFWCLTIADCCAAYGRRIHNAALDIIASDQQIFGWIANLSDVRASKEVILRR